MSMIWMLPAAVIIFFLVGGGLSLAPWVPTRKRDMERLNKFIDLKTGAVLYELGSGDGRVCHYLAKKNPQAKVVGIEISPLLFAIARLRLLFSPQPNLRFTCANFNRLNLSEADVFYVFGIKDSLPMLYKTLQSVPRKMPARLVSYAFHLPEIKAIRQSGKKGEEIILYEYRL